MRKAELSLEMRNAVVWLERQPGVTSVVKQRFVRSPKHTYKPGFTKIVSADDKSVHLRTFDRLGSRDLHVYAPRTGQRDQWVAKLAGGDVLDGVVPRTVTRHTSSLTQLVPPDVVDSTLPRVAPNEIVKPVEKDAAQLYDVTPTIAAEWLQRNTRNRKLKQAAVNRYAADMKAGRWLVTGDAIAFDTNGNIINGQHRLWAVLLADITVRMMVAFDLAPETVAVLDDHIKRSLSDVQQILRPGSLVTTLHTAIAAELIRTSIDMTATDKWAARQRITRQVQLDALDKHWDAIEFVYREAFHSTKMRGITVAPVLTPVTRAYYTQDHGRLKEFGRVMLSGQTDTNADVAAVVLRNYLMRQTTAGLRSASETIYRKTERALAAFLEGSKLSTLFEATTELFPLPEDMTTTGKRAARR